MKSPYEVVSSIYIRNVKVLIKSREVFSSFVGFLLSMDTFKRLIYVDH